jgi:hypothetical protein
MCVCVICLVCVLFVLCNRVEDDPTYHDIMMILTDKMMICIVKDPHHNVSVLLKEIRMNVSVSLKEIRINVSVLLKEIRMNVSVFLKEIRINVSVLLLLLFLVCCYCLFMHMCGVAYLCAYVVLFSRPNLPDVQTLRPSSLKIPQLH